MSKSNGPHFLWTTMYKTSCIVSHYDAHTDTQTK